MIRLSSLNQAPHNLGSFRGSSALSARSNAVLLHFRCLRPIESTESITVLLNPQVTQQQQQQPPHRHLSSSSSSRRRLQQQQQGRTIPEHADGAPETGRTSPPAGVHRRHRPRVGRFSTPQQRQQRPQHDAQQRRRRDQAPHPAVLEVQRAGARPQPVAALRTDPLPQLPADRAAVTHRSRQPATPAPPSPPASPRHGQSGAARTPTPSFLSRHSDDAKGAAAPPPSKSSSAGFGSVRRSAALPDAYQRYGPARSRSNLVASSPTHPPAARSPPSTPPRTSAACPAT